jgi:hypothetical protein
VAMFVAVRQKMIRVSIHVMALSNG